MGFQLGFGAALLLGVYWTFFDRTFIIICAIIFISLGAAVLDFLLSDDRTRIRIEQNPVLGLATGSCAIGLYALCFYFWWLVWIGIQKTAQLFYEDPGLVFTLASIVAIAWACGRNPR